MGQLRTKMEADLKIGGYSLNTQKIYLLYARKFAAHFMRSPAEMGADEVREFLLFLIEEEEVSRGTLRQVRSALCFLYRVTLNRPVEIEWLPTARSKKRLPMVLSGSEIAALLDATTTPMYRVILSAMYSGGLRISEACRLRPRDIDSKRMVITVVGKGDKERTTLLSSRLLCELRDYWRLRRPMGEWLFPGDKRGCHITRQSVGNAFKQAVADARLSKKVTSHVLRHSFATHLVDTGVPLSVVQALLGHKSIKTTSIYLHTSVRQIARTTSPLDLLESPAAAVLG